MKDQDNQTYEEKTDIFHEESFVHNNPDPETFKTSLRTILDKINTNCNFTAPVDPSFQISAIKINNSVYNIELPKIRPTVVTGPRFSISNSKIQHGNNSYTSKSNLPASFLKALELAKQPIK